METKKQYIERIGLKIGDQVKFTPSIIKRSKESFENPTAEELEYFGEEILRTTYERTLKTYTVVDFKNHNGQWTIESDMKDVIGNTSFHLENELIKVSDNKPNFRVQYRKRDMERKDWDVYAENLQAVFPLFYKAFPNAQLLFVTSIED